MLATLFILAIVILVLVFTVGTVSTFQLNAAQQISNSDQALYLAEGALQQTMSLLHSGITPPAVQFGRANEDVYFPSSSVPQYGEVSFDKSTTWGYSTNDFDGTLTTGWKGTSVPAGTAMLLARGQVGSSVRLIQAFVEIPTYQYVLSVDGALDSTGPLIATADSSMAQYVADTTGNNLNNLLPANIGANGNVTAPANSEVTGDVISTGTVDLASPSYIGGAIRNAHVDVPVISVTSQINNFLGSGSPATFTPAASGVTQISGDCYASGAVSIPGDLQLESGASLYVSGNLTIGGALYGVGQVFVNGSVQVNDGADLDASNLVALLCTGDVSLQGPSNASKYFQGLVYCEGGFTAANITVVGAFAAASNPSESTSSQSSPSVSLNNAPVVYVPDGATISEPNALSLVSEIRGNPPNWFPGEVWNPGASSGPYVDTLYNTIANGIGPTAVAILAANNSLSLSSTGLPYDGVVYQMTYECVQYDPTTQKFVPLNPPQALFYAGVPPEPTTQAVFQAAMVGAGCPYSLTDFETAMTAAQREFMVAANNILDPGPGLSNTYLSLNLNNFLSDSSPLHVVSWCELPPY